jgi:hypothetical protein
MNEPDQASAGLSRDLRTVGQAASSLTTQLRQLTNAGRGLSRSASACSDGSCSASGGGASSASNAGGLASTGANLGATFTRALSGSFSSVTNALQSAVRSTLLGLTRTLASTVARASGGGIFGGLLGSLVGGGLSAIVGGLFQRKHTVRVDNTVRAEVLNFPRLASLDFAVNPASRLLAGRASPRGPAFTVEVDYRHGAEDVVAAKVAGRLRDLNLLQGAV